VGNKRAGSRLYTHSVVDHEELFRIAASCAGDFLMTYEDAPELHDIARYHNFDTHVIPMKNGHHERMTELLVGRDLDWARD
jgi:DNA adenine methylase